MVESHMLPFYSWEVLCGLPHPLHPLESVGHTTTPHAVTFVV